ncbi:ammonium transporter [Vibrio sp. S4M6]|uniref:ammonium transporter n=1 Tax=Vibrio sinus TaxID=2946865 RepID=UPI002029F048|nr:ammonium transporter [Vibrio sinus]MCL9782478.1 ammonium transporter [Vibrio sinus]
MNGCQKWISGITVLFFSSPSMANDNIAQVVSNLDVLWVLVATGLVFFMQAGFTMLESGMIRAKNSYNVAVKNISDFTAAVLSFWFVGFALMFGSSAGGWLGSVFNSGIQLSEPMDYAFFIFQATFVGTAATIVAGAVAERMKFNAYLIISVVISTVIYPISGHWIWGSALLGGDPGWLEAKGFMDFAGSTVVHSVGGWVALAGVIVLGARKGRFDENGEPQDIPGHNLLVATLGVFILWFGWFGFNGGSTLTADGSIAKIIVNTVLSGCAGGLTALFISGVFNQGLIRVEHALNGILAGLVAITAGCAFVEPNSAILIGIIGAAIVYSAEVILLRNFKLDDPVGAIAVHGVGGIWGTIAIAFFAAESSLAAGSRIDQFFVQLTGVVSVFIWAFGMGLLSFYILRLFHDLRVSDEEEDQGLNVVEHGAKTVWLDTMRTMQKIVSTGDLRSRAEVELATEAGETAISFNHLLDRFHHSISLMSKSCSALQNDTQQLDQVVNTTKKQTSQQTDSVRDISGLVTRILDSAKSISESSAENSSKASSASEKVNSSVGQIKRLSHSIERLSEDLDTASQRALQVSEKTNSINEILVLVQQIAEQTNLLALNAAIESARAGELGRGFAVVADEVRNLAQRTQDATSNIQGQIEQLQSLAGESSKELLSYSKQMTESCEDSRGAMESLYSMIDAIDSITELNKEVESASRNQSTLSNQANEILESIQNNVEENVRSTEQLGSVSESLKLDFDRFSSNVSKYRI